MNRREIKKRIIKFLLKWPTKLMLAKHKPVVIGITGSVGKTSTKEAIYAVLKKRYSVWRSAKNYNTEIGVPLSVFGMTMADFSWISWFFAFLKIIKRLTRMSNYPDFLVLELGIDKPGDMAYLMKLARPEIGVVTAVGEIPVHVEFFAGPQEVAREKLRLVKSMTPSSTAILNYDDATIMDEADKIHARILTFGFGEGADIRAEAYEISGPGEEAGITFKIAYKGSFVPVRLKNIFGKSNAYSALAAAAVGITFDMNLVEISEALGNYSPPPGRLRLIRGIKDSWILDDSYNSSPLALDAALDVLKHLESKRDIVVLGDMRELGEYTQAAHQAAGGRLLGLIREIWTVGDAAKLIGEEAVKNGFDASNVFNFENSSEVGRMLQERIKPGDMILVKGSQSMRMEKIVEEIMAEPQRAKELLVRQEPPWK